MAFVSGRLTEAREARGYTITGLAEATGIAKQSLSNYEHGKRALGPRVLARLAEALSLPVHFFLRPVHQCDSNPIFFRSLAATTKRSRTVASRKLDWLIEIVDHLAEFVELLPVDIPNYDLGPDPGGVSEDKIERIAAMCRQTLGLGNGPISNVVRLLENHGVIVIRETLGTSNLDAFSKWSAAGIPLVILNADKDSAVRSRMDAAHEIGHLVLHRSVMKLGSYFKDVEQQAFRFASAFLLPADSFTKDFARPSLDTFRFLKEKWRVSITAMIMRCLDLQILGPEEARTFWVRYNERGWRRREPLDDQLPIEVPVFIQRCIDLIIDEGLQSKEDLIASLALSPTDLEQLLGLDTGYFSRSPFDRLKPRLTKKSAPAEPRVLPFRRKD